MILHSGGYHWTTGVACLVALATLAVGCTPGDLEDHVTGATETIGAGAANSASTDSMSPLREPFTVSPSQRVTADSDIPLSRRGEIMATPSELVGPTDEQELLVRQAHYAYTKKCMAANGYDLLAGPPRASDVRRSTIPVWEGNIGLLNRTYAGIHGYQWDLGDIRREQGEEKLVSGNRADKAASDGYDEALRGVDDSGGCETEAADAIEAQVPDTQAADQAVASIDAKGYAATLADADFKSIVSDWSTCMARQGYSYSDPIEASDSFDGFQSKEWLPGGPPDPTKAEIAVALADLNCKDDISMIDRYRRILWKHWSAMIDENRPTLEQLKKAWQKRVDNAVAIIKADGQ